MSTQLDYDRAPLTMQSSPAALRAVAVGVDGSPCNKAAVDWAVFEACRTGRELFLVSAGSEYSAPNLIFSEPVDAYSYAGDRAAHVVELVDGLRRAHPALEVHTSQKVADVAGLILLASAGAELVVVGKRGLRAFGRVVVGSTSLAVAGRSTVPAVVVPEGWVQAARSADVVVVGVDVTRSNDSALAFAFERARQLSMPLLAMNAWERRPLLFGSTEGRSHVQRSTDIALEEVLEPWAARFGDVELRVTKRCANPPRALWEASASAQLIVVGRHTTPDGAGGFAFDSVACAVVHNSSCPVVVVPEPDQA